MINKTISKLMVCGVVLFFISNFFVINSLYSASTYTPPKPGGLPNESAIVEQVEADHPDWLANMYDKYDNPNGTWQFLDEVVKQLRAKDPRWSYNGKRGNPKDPSADVVAYYYGPGTAPVANTINMFEVYAVDIMTYGQTTHWNDITDYSEEPCVYGSYLYPRNSPMAVPELPETPPSCDTTESPTPTPPIIPPPPPDSAIDVLPGWFGDLAFNTKDDKWLLVTQGELTPGNLHILGRFLTSEGAISGPGFNISPPSSKGKVYAPSIAYSSDINKFLVVWSNAIGGNGDPRNLSEPYGIFVNPDGTTGNAFRINPNGTMNIGSEKSSVLKYDSKNKKFVLIWMVPGGGPQLTTITTTGEIGPIINLFTGQGGGNWSPKVAVNEDKNEYCTVYDQRNSGKWAVRQVNASNLSPGSESVVSMPVMSMDIAYDPSSEK